MTFEQLVNLKYHVIKGVAIQGKFNPDITQPVMREENIDPLLTNARNLFMTLDCAAYLIYDMLEVIQGEQINNKILGDRAKSLIDVIRMALAAALGQDLPELIYPEEFTNEYSSPVGMSSINALDATISQLQDISTALQIAYSEGGPADDTIERLTAKSTVDTVQPVNNIIQVIPSRWKQKKSVDGQSTDESA